MSRLRWEEFQDVLHKYGKQLVGFNEKIWFQDGEPEEPEVYPVYKKCEKWGPWWAGGVADQPHFLMTEFEVCRKAEDFYRDNLKGKFEEYANALSKQSIQPVPGSPFGGSLPPGWTIVPGKAS